MQWRKCRGKVQNGASSNTRHVQSNAHTFVADASGTRRVTKRGYQDPEECASTGDCRGSLRRAPEKSRAA